MNGAREIVVPGTVHRQPLIGTTGRLAIFVGLIFSAVQLPITGLALIMLILIGVGLVSFRPALRKILRWRWLLFLIVMVVPPALWQGERETVLGGITFSAEGLQLGLAMALRAGIMLAGVMWFTSSVDISEVAGLLERTGLRGLGFSMGVAVNLLPSLLQSYRNAWYTLQMRGGLGKLRLRTARLLLVTVFANALRRADEITLVAELRAFSPECSRSLPLKKGRYDLLIVAGVLAANVIAYLVH